MIVSVLKRRLREGKTYEDFREAWLPDKGFGVNTRVISAVSMEDPRDIVTIGFAELDPGDVEAFVERVGPQEKERHDRLKAVVEPGGDRGFYLQVADDDLTDAPPPE